VTAEVLLKKHLNSGFLLDIAATCVKEAV